MPDYVRYTDDVEVVQPDEADVIDEIMEVFDRLRRLTFEKHRHAVRDAHAKSHGILRGTLAVLGGLDAPLAQGLFARPGAYDDVIARFSTSPGDILADGVGGFRGLSLKVFGVEGERLVAEEADAATQDFLFVNHPVIPTGDVKSYLAAERRMEKLAHAPEPVQELLTAGTRAGGAALRALGIETPAGVIGQAKPHTHPLARSRAASTSSPTDMTRRRLSHSHASHQDPMTRPTDDTDAREFALVTGASSGIGLELAKVFAQHGYDLLITADEPAIDDAAETLRALGAQVDSVQLDLAQQEGVDRLYERVRAAGRPLDAAALNAGRAVGGAFLDNDFAEERRSIDLNVVSTVHLAKHVLRDMVARGEGRVLFTSSIAAEMPGPYYAVYAATKAFVQSFAEAVRNELKDTNVVVTALQPGATDTNFFARAGMEDTKVGVSRKSDPADVAREGFEALMKGKDHVVAAMTKEKIQVAAAQVTPEPILAQMHGKQVKPGSGSR